MSLLGGVAGPLPSPTLHLDFLLQVEIVEAEDE